MLRDVVAALAMRQADQQGIHIAFYGSGRQLNNNGDLPWLDPFSALERRRSATQISQDTQESHDDYNIELPAITQTTNEEQNSENSDEPAAGELQKVSEVVDLEEQISESETLGDPSESQNLIVSQEVDLQEQMDKSETTYTVEPQELHEISGGFDLEEQVSESETTKDSYVPHKISEENELEPTGECGELQAMSKEVVLSEISMAELLCLNVLESNTSELIQQNHVISLQESPVRTSESAVSITESDSEESDIIIWVTPNTSPSSSVTALHTLEVESVLEAKEEVHINMESCVDAVVVSEIF